MPEAPVRQLISSLEFAALPSAVPCARLHARAVTCEWGYADIARTVEIVVSELVTNAIVASNSPDLGPRYERRPGMPAVCLRLSSDHQRVLVEVWDDVPIAPTRRQVVIPDDESGRGLMLVDALSERWGCYAAEGQHGKVVWAQIRIEE
jgi:anti-sigma regulatory factor (Ser/Thr protein kinase)